MTVEEAEATRQGIQDGHQAADRQGLPRLILSISFGVLSAPYSISWMNERAILYRKMEGIPAEWGTAVSVMAMVFGNMGDTSATGVCFSRDAATGENLFQW